jgi:hypothetical protein
MVQQIISLGQFQPILAKALGCNLPEKTVADLYAQLQIIESSPSEAFWQSESAEAGLYV